MESDRIRLRKYKKEDAVNLYNTLNDERVLKYIPEDKIDMKTAESAVNWLMDNYKKSLDEDYKYSYVIELKSTGEYIGWCGFGYLDFDKSKTEIYYTLNSKFWGNGYAEEAARLVLKHMKVIGIKDIVAVVKADNKPSIRIIESLGFKYVKVLENLDSEFEFYEGELYYQL